MPAVNRDKTATFDKATKTVTITSNEKLQYGGDRGLYLGLNNFNINDYNIVRIKYKVIGDYGINFTLDYDDNTLDWDDKTTYCPSYLNEMVIPFKSNQRRLKGIIAAGTWHIIYEQFVIESVTFEKVANPVITDIYASDEPPVIDTAASGKFDDKTSAWDYVTKLGVGFQYFPFGCNNPELDFGMDCYHPGSFKKPSKEAVHFIREKGFKTLRLQTNPNSHLLDENYTIDPRYIKAIKEVVDWAISEDMYVIICGPFSDFLANPKFQKKAKESVHYEGVSVSEDYNKKTQALLKAIWKQYAAAFNNSYDEHLIFETLNEPADIFHEHAWNPKNDCVVCKKDYAILNEYNQLIVDTIRSSGGNNAKRFIMVEGLTGKWNYITTNLFKMPKDKANDKLIYTAHTYPMGGVPDTVVKYYTNGIKGIVDDMFATFDKMYFSKHIPVYISEVGHQRGIPIMERIKFMKDFMADVTKSDRSCAVTLHIDPQHPLENDYVGFCYYNSFTLKWFDTEYLDTVLYAAKGKELKLSEDFIKKNTLKNNESIIDKNLLKEPVEKKNWGMSYRISSDIFYHSTPATYKIEFEIERTGNNPELDFAYMDLKESWHNESNTVLLKNMRVKGGSNQGNIKVKAKKVILTIDEDLAREIAENSIALFLNGQDIIIKSMTVVE